MAPVKRTESGVEMTRQFLALLAVAVGLGGGFIGVTAAGVRAADRLQGTASKAELHDSVSAIRRDERAYRAIDSVHEARQDTATSWYARQTWALLCKQSGNPEAFCSRDAVMQAGRPR